MRPFSSRQRRSSTALAAAGGRQPVTVITPQQKRPSSLVDILARRDLLFILAARDVKVRYRQTALGASWVILQPMLVSGVFTFVFGRVARLPSEGVPYFVFSYAGLLCWNQFASLLQRVAGSLMQNTSLVAKVYFPRLALPYAAVLSTMVDFAVSLAVMAVMLLSARVPVRPAVLFLPVFIVIVTLIATGIGLVAAGVVVRYRDVQYLTPLLLQLLLYASPVAYATSAIPSNLRFVFALNPLVGVLDGFRWCLLPHSPLHGFAVAYSAVACLPIFFVGKHVFQTAERGFADVI